MEELSEASWNKEWYKYTPIHKLLPHSASWPHNSTNESSYTRTDSILEPFVKHKDLFADPFLDFTISSLSIHKPIEILKNEKIQDNPVKLNTLSTEDIAHFILKPRASDSFFHISQEFIHAWPTITNLYLKTDPIQKAEICLDIDSLEEVVGTLNFLVLQSEKSQVKVNILMRGKGLVRCSLYSVLNGVEAKLDVRTLILSSGKSHQDFHSVILHEKPSAISREIVRILGFDKSVSAFGGKIFVAPHAQKTDAYQSSKSTLYSEEARVYARPFLEIYADDVRCSHGCTSGVLDQLNHFYLRSRGIPDKTARKLLAMAFARSCFEHPEETFLNHPFYKIIDKKLEKCI